MAAKLGAKPAPAANRTTTSKDNQTEEQIAEAKAEAAKAEREARRIQRISIRHHLRIAKANSAEAKAAYDAVKEKETEVYRLAKAAGYTRADLDEDLVDMNMDPREYRKKEALRAERKSDFADVGQQASLIDDKTAPIEQQDEAYWHAKGYRAGMSWEKCSSPPECPPNFISVWARAWQIGSDDLKAALDAADAAAAEEDEEPATDPPTEQSALDAIAEAEPEIVAQVKEDHGFEATAEELAAQKHRPKAPDDEAV